MTKRDVDAFPCPFGACALEQAHEKRDVDEFSRQFGAARRMYLCIISCRGCCGSGSSRRGTRRPSGTLRKTEQKKRSCMDTTWSTFFPGRTGEKNGIKHKIKRPNVGKFPRAGGRPGGNSGFRLDTTWSRGKRNECVYNFDIGLFG